jgi:hypothetical protein
MSKHFVRGMRRLSTCNTHQLPEPMIATFSLTITEVLHADVELKTRRVGAVGCRNGPAVRIVRALTRLNRRLDASVMRGGECVVIA